MRAYIVSRLIQFIPVIIGVTFLVFSTTLLLPGDPVTALLGLSAGQATFTPEQIERYRHDLGLDRPIPVQYAKWLGRAVQGDFGDSIKTRRPVTTEVLPRRQWPFARCSRYCLWASAELPQPDPPGTECGPR